MGVSASDWDRPSIELGTKVGSGPIAEAVEKPPNIPPSLSPPTRLYPRPMSTPTHTLSATAPVRAAASLGLLLLLTRL
ncbi:hypothetical protein SAMN05421759_10281 [Roseivivax lentus]|uniref:Uncharacterized protein n=1 Tax=Roseivivax lentus TaxID=633194 RepID=A0A1N7KUI7_9RHOB|nr:hypothetical protein SAMN05421759_10281 [Roseivivax lentus]